MASTTLTFQAPDGETVTLYMEADGGSGTPAASYSATEKSTASGWYSVTITEALVGKFLWRADDGSANVIATGMADLQDVAETFYGYDPSDSNGGVVDGNAESRTKFNAPAGGIGVVANAFTKTTGGTETNAYTDTATLSADYHSILPNAGDTDIQYDFDIGPGTFPTEVHWIGYARKKDDEYFCYLYNFVNDEFDIVGLLIGTKNEDLQQAAFLATSEHVDTDGTVTFRVTSSDGDEFVTARLTCYYMSDPAETTTGKDQATIAASNTQR